MKKGGLLGGSAAFAALGVAGVVHGQVVIYVDQSNPTPGDGRSWDTALTSLTVAAEAGSIRFDGVGGEIRLAGGVYHVQHAYDNRVRASSTVSGLQLTISGGYGGRGAVDPDARDFVATPTVITCDVNGDDGPDFSNRSDNQLACVSMGSSFEGGTIRATVSGIEFEGAIGDALGLNAISLTLQDCVFRNNGRAFRIGLGDYNSFFVQRCRFENNRVGQGALGGGAISLYMHGYGFGYISDSVFVENRAPGDGGAVWIEGPTPYDVRFVNCAFVGNTAGGSGGAISGYADALSCLFSGNVAALNGGAFDRFKHVLFSTVVGNHAAWGGGLRAESPPSATISDSILWGNTASMDGQQLASSAPFPLMSRTVVQGGPAGMLLPFQVSTYLEGTNYFTFEPQFANPNGPDGMPETLLDNDYHLTPRSPAVDSGLGDTVQLDLDGNPRQRDGIRGRGTHSDLGCYESQITLCPTDLDADGGITVDDLVAFLQAFELGDGLADLTRNGSTPFPDGAVTIDDLLYFLARFEAGC